MPKRNRHGQATVLSPETLQILWDELEQPHRVITQILYFTASRIKEICSLRATDRAGNYFVIQRAQTKTKKTKEAPINPVLDLMLREADLPEHGYLFPSDSYRTRSERGHIHPRTVDHALRKVTTLLTASDIRFDGVSSHSFRRSALTHLAGLGENLKHIQAISAHEDLRLLQRYIEVTPEKKFAVANRLGELFIFQREDDLVTLQACTSKPQNTNT